MEKIFSVNEDIAKYFTIGQIVDIEIQDLKNKRFQSQLIGLKDKSYLVVEQPSVIHYGKLRDQIQNRQEIIVRTICEKTTGDCLGFKSDVSSKLDHPGRLLFLSFPLSIKLHELRREQRLQVRQDAVIRNTSNEKPILCSILDISANGCRVEFSGEKTSNYRKEDTIFIEFIHPETNINIQCKAEIRSLSNGKDVITLDLAYINNNL